MNHEEKLVPRWCKECSHYQPKNAVSAVCLLRKCTMKPDFHAEGLDNSGVIGKDCAKLQGWRGKRVLDVLSEVKEREARAAEMLAMQPKHQKRDDMDPAKLALSMCAACVSGPYCGKQYPACGMYNSKFGYRKPEKTIAANPKLATRKRGTLEAWLP